MSAADTQPLVELVLEARAEVIVNVTDVDSVVIVLLSSSCCILHGRGGTQKINCPISSKQGYYTFQGHQCWYQLKALCDFLLVINTNWHHIL